MGEAARASPSRKKEAGKRPNPVQSQRSSRQRSRSIAYATPQVEVIAQGEVADVEEIEGIRVLMDDQNRPMVEYLIKWKVRVILLSKGCHYLQSRFPAC